MVDPVEHVHEHLGEVAHRVERARVVPVDEVPRRAVDDDVLGVEIAVAPDRRTARDLVDELGRGDEFGKPGGDRLAPRFASVGAEEAVPVDVHPLVPVRRDPRVTAAGVPVQPVDHGNLLGHPDRGGDVVPVRGPAVVPAVGPPGPGLVVDRQPPAVLGRQGGRRGDARLPAGPGEGDLPVGLGLGGDLPVQLLDRRDRRLPVEDGLQPVDRPQRATGHPGEGDGLSPAEHRGELLGLRPDRHTGAHVQGTDHATGSILAVCPSLEGQRRCPIVRSNITAGRGLGWTAIGLSVVAAAASAFVVRDERSQAATLAEAKAATAAAQSQIAALSAQLTTTQNKLAADEKQLQVTTDSLPPDIAKLADAAAPSVVLVSCGSSVGAGFAMDLGETTEGTTTIVTAAHVVDTCAPSTGGGTPDTATVIVAGRSLTARLKSFDPEGDVALFTVNARLPALQPSASAPRSGDFVMTIGNPLGASELVNSVTQGNVSKVLKDYISNTASISNGNSGGPLINRSGKVVGIIDSALTSASVGQPVVENLNFAVRLRVLCHKAMTGQACAHLSLLFLPRRPHRG